MADDYVVDTNVFVWVDKPIADVKTTAELDCIQSCRDWLRDFISRDCRLVIDNQYRILKEYRRNIRRDGRASELLKLLESQPLNRLVALVVAFDENNKAVVPESVMSVDDDDDRLFVAVALAHNPIPPIVDATDTDWEKAREALTAVGIVVKELCPTYIAEKLRR